jgi:regulatory protein
VSTEQSAYVAALKMLGSRELSEAQVRQRLARRGHDVDAIDSAVRRLLDEHLLDDRRVAAAIARTQIGLKRRGRLRVVQHIERAGISRATARQAADEALAELDPDALIEAAAARRLRGRPSLADEREFQRMYRFLVGQGFEPERVLKVLRRKR